MTTQTPTYRVIVNGVQPGKDPERVRAEAARLFRIDESKAGALIKGRRVVKKGLERQKAQAFEQRLAGIGLVVELEEQVSVAAAAGMGLALEPLEEPARDSQQAEDAQEALEAQKEQGTHSVTCPKCSLVQAASHDKCIGCGFSLASLRRKPAAPVAEQDNAAPPRRAPMLESGTALPGQAMAAAGGTALLGALAWSFIAIKSGYEFGLLAWGIGAGIGIAASMAGGRGNGSATLCAVLALFSLLGGKYLIAAGMEEEMMAMFSDAEVEQELYPVYEEHLADARAYRDVTGEASLRRFMVEREYTFASRPQDVDDYEIELFRELNEPMLLSMAANEPSYEEWRAETFDVMMNTIGVPLLFLFSFGLMDILFFILGIGTAWQLGRGVDIASG